MRLSLHIGLLLSAALLLPFGLGLWTLMDDGEAPVDERDVVLARMTGRLVSRDLQSSNRIFEISRELFDLSRLPAEELTGVLRMLYKQDEDLSVVVLLNGQDEAAVQPVFLRAEQIEKHGTDSRLPVDEGDLARFLKHLPVAAAREGGRAVSGVYVDRRRNAIFFAGATLVPSGDGGKPWVLGYERSLRRVHQIVGAAVDEPLAQIFVVDHGGRLVVHPDGQRFLNREIVADNPLVQLFLQEKKKRRLRWQDASGNWFQGAWTGLDQMDWAVVVQRPVPEFRTGLPAWVWLAWGGMAMVLAMLAWLLARKVAGLQLEAEKLKAGYEKRQQELQRVQASLLETRKLNAIGDLGAGVAHEFNNPLGGILGLTQLLLRKKGEEDPDRRFLLRIEAEAKRCKEITGNLLRFSEQQGAEHREPIRLSRVADMALDLMRSKLDSERIKIETDYQDETARVNASQGQLQRAVINLVQNAETAMGDEGTLRFSIKRDGDWAELAISDTGRGIPKENLGKVFEPFFTTKDNWKGAGLGLWVVFQIVEDHGGVVGVESEVDKGTTVTLRLPVWHEKSGESATKASVPLA